MREKNRKRTNYLRSEMLTAGGLGLKVILRRRTGASVFKFAAGDDTLLGGAGNDILDGGTGADATCGEAKDGLSRRENVHGKSGRRRWIQVGLRRTVAPPDRCFLPDLTRFGDFRRTGPEPIFRRRKAHST